MKRAGRIIAGMVLGTAFAAAVGINFLQSSKEQKEEQETTKQIVIQPAERKLYEIGEDVKCGDLIWNITGAEIIKDYDSLDSYYKNRKNIISPEEVLLEDLLIFKEEVQYLLIKGTITNISKYVKRCDFGDLQMYNHFEDGSFGPEINAYHYRNDCRYISEDEFVRTVDNCWDPFTVKEEETVEFEYVMQFSEYEDWEISGYFYDLYLSTKSFFPSDVKDQPLLEEKIHLNIAPKHLGITKTEAENTYDEQRDITGMKCRQWVNMDMKQYQTEGYPIIGNQDIEFAEPEEVTEEDFVLFRGLTSQIKSVQIVDWEGLPKEFSDRNALQNMAECYNRAGYEKEQMKILLLEMVFGNAERDDVYALNFYNSSCLFTRDEAGKRWVFGSTDDWIVTENTAQGKRTGHINGEWLEKGESVTVCMAYLLTPEMYEEETVYYYGTGLSKYFIFNPRKLQKISFPKN